MFDWRLFKRPFYILKRLQKASLRKAGTLLRGRLRDVGCGESFYRELCPNTDYIGLDRTPGLNTAVLGDGLDLPFKDGMLDAAVPTDVLEPVRVARIGAVCSLIHMRMIDVAHEVIQKMRFFLTPKYRKGAGLVALLPFLWILYYLSLLLDRFDRRDALGWAILARKIA